MVGKKYYLYIDFDVNNIPIVVALPSSDQNLLEFIFEDINYLTFISDKINSEATSLEVNCLTCSFENLVVPGNLLAYRS